MVGVGDGMNWEIGIDMYTLICIKWITNKNLLYKKVIKLNLKISKKELRIQNKIYQRLWISL